MQTMRRRLNALTGIRGFSTHSWVVLGSSLREIQERLNALPGIRIISTYVKQYKGVSAGLVSMPFRAFASSQHEGFDSQKDWGQ